jgi:hypothetical protein
MTFKEFFAVVRNDFKFWHLLAIYIVCTPLAFYCAYISRHNMITMILFILLGLYHGVNAIITLNKS